MMRVSSRANSVNAMLKTGICRLVMMRERDGENISCITLKPAVSAAVNAFNKELLASHIHTCVARDIRDGKDEVIDELVTTLQKLMR